LKGSLLKKKKKIKKILKAIDPSSLKLFSLLLRKLLELIARKVAVGRMEEFKDKF